MWPYLDTPSEEDFDWYHNVYLPNRDLFEDDDGSVSQSTALFDAETSSSEQLHPSEEQLAAFELMENFDGNLFITGKAGTGKSYVLRYFKAMTKQSYAVVAPTGIAALNVHGQTIHSFFGISREVQNPSDNDMVYKSLEKRKQLLKSLDLLIIDEISMVRVDLMDMIDAKLRAARNVNRAFGGCKIVCFGDLYQLPPVVTDAEIQNYLEDRYGTIFFFGAPGFALEPFKTIELETVHRQSDSVFINALNKIRVGIATPAELAPINRNIVSSLGKNVITLAPTNKTANNINTARLNEIDQPEHYYEGDVFGNFDEDEFPTERILTLKIGAQVMFIKNDSRHPRRFVNGTIGTVTQLTDDLIVVTTSIGVPCKLDKETWTKYAYAYDAEKGKLIQKEVGYFRQYPLRLAYAITIHKSQGQTYDKVCIDYSERRAFSPGQTYVALSRCKSLDGLFLKDPIKEEDIKVNQEVLDFMHGNYTPHRSSSKHYKLPSKPEKPQKPEFHIEEDKNQIVVSKPVSPKKITGRRISGVTGLDKFKTPFATWCEIEKVYEEPFEGNEKTKAGEIIEPKQFEYVKKVLAGPGRKFIKPVDIFGEDYKETTRYDFFHYEEIFGGMWDYIMQENGLNAILFEMKTTHIKNIRYWNNTVPDTALSQAALYAHLLHMDTINIVVSFLYDVDYADPEQFVCNSANTKIYSYSLKNDLGAFRDHMVKTAIDWWNKHVVTGVSPVYTEKDANIIQAIEEEQKNVPF